MVIDEIVCFGVLILTLFYLLLIINGASVPEMAKDVPVTYEFLMKPMMPSAAIVRHKSVEEVMGFP